MVYVGIDLHRKRSQIAVLDQDGKQLLSGRIVNDPQIFLSLLQEAVDARTLAHLLRTDLLPEACVAPRQLRDLRDLLRHRVALTRMRSALKNRVHALLARQGVQPTHTDLFGPGGRRFLAELPLREPARRRLDSSLVLIDCFDRRSSRPAARSTPAPGKTPTSRCSARSAASAAPSPCS